MARDNEDQAILNEITEELKHDQFIRFVKRYQTPIFGTIISAIACIVMYTSWQSRVQKELEDTTYGLVDTILSRTNKSDIILTAMAENAPAKIKPIVVILSNGVKLRTEKDNAKKKAYLDDLLKLSSQNGVDVIWRDLATLIYASNIIQNKNTKIEEIANKLTPLTEESRPFRLSALELLGLIYSSSSDKIKAKFYFESILSDKTATETMKKRALLYKNRLFK